ncbi:helix-turn-helix transcriptional regulator [Antrihabitans stalactiti]|uniref:Helix-turn-helix transcriptional regulator n=1 Tax=Antrihabitans stalactiti TaxID=2584121 RepID=A0A848KG40_9NOCA|nr:helix-turn-helix transcriptional regulator [Antrihabitans stalactiti]NMN97745.1 helix-turn-helix transcriptional regulator [Antrihabitans stalactiti]
MTGVSDGAFSLPTPRLRQFVRGYEGYWLSGFPPGKHVGMPSTSLTVIITIGDPLEIAEASHPDQHSTSWTSLASGITVVPCTIAHDGNQHGIQVGLTPLGARAIFGMPTAELGAWMVDLDDILGADARELRDRVSSTPDWRRRFAVLDEIFSRRAERCSIHDAPMNPALEQAWSMLAGNDGQARVGDVAEEIGWSRRHLVNQFTAEFGITPKDSARIARFSAAHAILRRPEIPSLADVAAMCGYYDQAHMARDWRDLAGMSPSKWRASEVFTFVQDSTTPELADLAV